MGCTPRNPFLMLFCAFRINRLQTAISNSATPRAAALGMGREDHPNGKRALLRGFAYCSPFQIYRRLCK
jgi:hypothetical protein